jgi:hypothetical protein
VYVSYLSNRGSFSPTFAHAAEFTRLLKAQYPEVDVQAWLGLPLNHGFDGVHLDPEPVPTGDPDALKLLDDVRVAIGPSSMLSIATPKIQPIFSDWPVPWIGGLVWQTSYLREVAQRVNQVAVMTYDSYMPLPALYRFATRHQVIAASQALDGMNVELFVGVPTSEERTASHWPNAENIEAGLQGVVDGLNDAEARPRTVTGVAVYPDWETDAQKWVTYEELWLGLAGKRGPSSGV